MLEVPLARLVSPRAVVAAPPTVALVGLGVPLFFSWSPDSRRIVQASPQPPPPPPSSYAASYTPDPAGHRSWPPLPTGDGFTRGVAEQAWPAAASFSLRRPSASVVRSLEQLDSDRYPDAARGSDARPPVPKLSRPAVTVSASCRLEGGGRVSQVRGDLWHRANTFQLPFGPKTFACLSAPREGCLVTSSSHQTRAPR